MSTESTEESHVPTNEPKADDVDCDKDQPPLKSELTDVMYDMGIDSAEGKHGKLVLLDCNSHGSMLVAHDFLFELSFSDITQPDYYLFSQHSNISQVTLLR